VGASYDDGPEYLFCALGPAFAPGSQRPVDVETAAAMKRPIIGRTHVPSGTIRLMADVVVVGGGAAGCVVAALLAGRGRSVLLLEAGPDRRADLPDELHNGWTIEREPFDWGYKSEPDSVHEPRPCGGRSCLGGRPG
jgi:NAD(P)-binding Rossmann-like domain